MPELSTYWMHVIDTNPIRMVALFHSIWARNRFAPLSRFGDGPEVSLRRLILSIGRSPSSLSCQPLSDGDLMKELRYCSRYGPRGGRRSFENYVG